MLVSCVCPTTPERYSLLLGTIANFIWQTVPIEHREFLIAIGQNDELPPHFEEFPNTRVIRVPRCTLGEKRNRLVAHARGQFIAHFDDDDWSAPSRLEFQLDRLASNPRFQATGFCRMKFTDGENWWEYIGDSTWPLGTSLLYSRHWATAYPFPHEQIASDTPFITTARRAGVMDSVPCEDRMYATIHKNNTSVKAVADRNNYKPLPREQGIYPARMSTSVTKPQAKPQGA